MLSPKTIKCLLCDMRKCMRTPALKHRYYSFCEHLKDACSCVDDYKDCIEVITKNKDFFSLDTCLRDRIINSICKTIIE